MFCSESDLLLSPLPRTPPFLFEGAPAPLDLPRIVGVLGSDSGQENLAFGPDFDRILFGKASKSASPADLR